MMSAPLPAKSRHWAQINEAGFVAGMQLLFWICRIFGRWPFRIVLYPVLIWYILVKQEARAASVAYLQRIRNAGCASALPRRFAVLRHFAAFGECILDKMLLWGGLFDTRDTVYFGEQALVDDIARQSGGLIICSHFGNLELSRILARQRKGLKLTVLVHTKHAQKFNRLLERLDPASQLNLLQVTEMSPVTAMLLNERVAQGEFVVIAGDRIPVLPGQNMTQAVFLGSPAPFPVGPYVLASLLQCPVHLLFSMRVGHRHEIHFERFRDAIRLPRKGRGEALAVLAQEYASRLEHHCRRAPLQWFNFFDFWHLPEQDKTDASR